MMQVRYSWKGLSVSSLPPVLAVGSGHVNPALGASLGRALLALPTSNRNAGIGWFGLKSLERQLKLPKLLNGRKRRERELILLPPLGRRAVHELAEDVPAFGAADEIA